MNDCPPRPKKRECDCWVCRKARLQPDIPPGRSKNGVPANYIIIVPNYTFDSEKEMRQYLENNFPACSTIRKVWSRTYLHCEVVTPEPNKKQEEIVNQMERKKR